jgi:acyl-[acyl-carrier-protein] desaturase
MAALTASVSAVAPSSQRVASTGALRQRSAPSAATPRGRVAANPPHAVAAPETRHHQGPVIVNGQVLHSATKEQLDVVANMDKYAEEHVLPILKPTEKCWQPQDFLPDPESPDFADAVRGRKEAGAGLAGPGSLAVASGERAGGVLRAHLDWAVGAGCGASTIGCFAFGCLLCCFD